MKAFREGELVSVSKDDVVLDGVVAHTESILKIVVAVPDSDRGAILRTVHPRTLTERKEPGPDDQALQRLIQRTPSTGRGGPRGGQGPGRGQRGHTRGPGHRTTGR